MSYQWTDSDRRFQSDVDDMLQDAAQGELADLAVELDEGQTSLAPGLAGRVAQELRSRAAAGVLFRSMPGPLSGKVDRLGAEDDIPW